MSSSLDINYQLSLNNKPLPHLQELTKWSLVSAIYWWNFEFEISLTCRHKIFHWLVVAWLWNYFTELLFLFRMKSKPAILIVYLPQTNGSKLHWQRARSIFRSGVASSVRFFPRKSYPLCCLKRYGRQRCFCGVYQRFEH